MFIEVHIDRKRYLLNTDEIKSVCDVDLDKTKVILKNGAYEIVDESYEKIKALVQRPFIIDAIPDKIPPFLNKKMNIPSDEND